MRRSGRHIYDELARVILPNERVETRMIGATTAGGVDEETQVDGLPMPLGSVGDVLTVVTDGTDTTAAWATPHAPVTVTDSSSIDLTLTGQDITAAIVDEYVRDLVGGLLVAGTNVTITVDDPLNTITIAATGGGGGLTQEQIEDFIGTTLLVAGNNVDITYNDGAGTITIDVESLTEADIASLVSDLANKQPLDATLTDLAALAPPGADRIVFYDQSATAHAYLTAGSGLSISGTTITATAPGVSGNDPFFAAWISQNYYNTAGFLGAMDATVANNALTIDTMHASLCRIPEAASFDQVGLIVTGSIALSTVRLGVYAMGADGLPGALIADWGTVASTSNATLTLSISWSPAAGWYYIAQSGSHAVGTGRITAGVPALPYGRAVTTFSPVTDWTRASAGSSAALPNPFGASPGATGTHRPIWLRAA